MIDNLSNPMAQAASSVSGTTSSIAGMEQAFGGMAKAGGVAAGIGAGITAAALAPVAATFETKRALGELSAMGVEDLQMLENAAKDFSDTWAGTMKSDFLTAAIDIKGGIDSLSEEGISKYTEIAGITAKATGSTINEMTSLFATGYGIYKDYYESLSDIEFAEIFSAGIAKAILVFKASGSSMAQSITALGGSATTANVPLEEQLAVLGMLQATMSGSEAGTKYRAFLRSAAKASKELKLSFMDSNNELKSMPEILETLKAKYGDTLDAIEKQEIQKAFGSDEAVALIDLLYSKTGTLQDSILELYGSMGEGVSVATNMANAINSTEPDKYLLLNQKVHNVKETIGNSLLPVVNEYLDKGTKMAEKASDWIQSHQSMVRVIMMMVLALGVFLTVGGTTVAVVGGIGLIVTKSAGMIFSFGKIVRGIPSLLETMQIKAMYAGDAVRLAFGKIRSAATMVVTGMKNVVLSILNFAKTAVINGAQAIKSFVLGLANMAKQAIITAVRAIPSLVASVWSFTAALLANPVTWVVVGIIALIAALYLLWKNWDKVVAFIQNVFHKFVDGIVSGFNWIKDKIASMPIAFQILLAAIFPIIGIPMLIINHWETIVGFFTGLWTRVKSTFTNGIQNIKDFMNGVPTWFKESGKKVIETFTEGIKSMVHKPVDAIKGALAKVRKLLPFSDAKEGPLSTLTLSGRRVLETVTTGINQVDDVPAKAVEKSFEKIDLSPKKSVRLKRNIESSDAGDYNSPASDGKGKTVIIQKLMMNLNIRDIDELKKVFKLIHEIEDYTDANGGEIVDGLQFEF